MAARLSRLQYAGLTLAETVPLPEILARPVCVRLFPVGGSASGGVNFVPGLYAIPSGSGLAGNGRWSAGGRRLDSSF